jgi:superfamily II DNA or RNA helicase/HKD family nuclease
MPSQNDSTFITNSQEKSLKNRLITLIKNSEELKFLVGFFYFSGIEELYETLKNLYEANEIPSNFLKILVGLNIDETNYGIVEIARKNRNLNIVQEKEAFISSLRKAFTSSDTDNEQTYKQAEFFLQLLKEGKLVLRKTKEPNHAKLYLFKTKESVKDILPHLFITGSSNLTKAGLESQNEFNVEIKDYGFSEAEEYFDRLWNGSIELRKEDVEKIFKVLKEETFLREITPLEAYAFVLKTYLDINKVEPSLRKQVSKLLRDRGYKEYEYQLEAVWQAGQNCKNHGGTILADVVGLGKTIMACLTAKTLGKRGIVICPPHLIGDQNSGWRKYLRDFKLFDWEIFSLGKLEDALEFVKDEANGIEMVIVDEAHRFRNQRTLNYHLLREICRDKTVLLLTATPFNNKPSDIFSLLKLFTIPKKSTLSLDGDLEVRFWRYGLEFQGLSYIRSYWNSKDRKKRDRARKIYEKLFGVKVPLLDANCLKRVSERAKELAREIRAIIEPVVIRRNRLDLRYYKDYANIPLSEVKDPEPWFFALTKEQSTFYDEVIKSFLAYDEGGKFSGAIYFPAKYEMGLGKWLEFLEGEETEGSKESFMVLFQRNLYDFMRRHLVKRFESSFGAFYQSLENFKSFHESALKFIKKTGKFVLDRKFMERVVGEEDEDRIEEMLAEYQRKLEEKNALNQYDKIYNIDEFEDKEEFLRDIENDLRLFEILQKKMEELGLRKSDPKAEKLVEGLEKFVKEGRKVVIFTEYIDTARHLEAILRNHPALTRRILPAIGNLSKETVEKIYRNFDAQFKYKDDDYDILLTTDKLSEGFNLNRAGAVINYDIPWNPVRVIQRVGRINRIGAKLYDVLCIVNFFPTERGADLVKSREIAESKMFMIHNVLGEDAKIFSPDEEPQPSKLYHKLTTYPEEEEGESFFTKLRRDYEELISTYPELEKSLEKMPTRVKVGKKGENDELMVFVRRGNILLVGYQEYPQNDKAKPPIEVSFESVLDKIRAKKEDEPLPLSDYFWKAYTDILEKKFAGNAKPFRPNSLEGKAFSILKNLIDSDNELIKPYKDFLTAIIEDLRNYRTIADYTLDRIADWENLIQQQRFEQLAEEIKRLRNEIGADFYEKLLQREARLKDEIIIAVENQRRDEDVGEFQML